MLKVLRDEINEAVTRYLENRLQTNSAVDIAAMAREMAQCLIDMVMEQDAQNQPLLLAQIIATLGEEYLQRRGFIPNERRDN
jgi:DNA-binding protein Fis